MVRLPESELGRLRKSRPWIIGSYGLLLAGFLYSMPRDASVVTLPLVVVSAVATLGILAELLSFWLLKARADIVYIARLCLLSALPASLVPLSGGFFPLTTALSLAPVIVLTLAFGPGSGALAAAAGVAALLFGQFIGLSVESAVGALVIALGVPFGVTLERYFASETTGASDFSDLIGFENVMEGVIVTDSAARVYYLNPAAAVAIRSDREGATGMPLTALLPLDSDASQPLDGQLRSALQSGRPQSLRGRLISRVAPGRMLDISISPLPEGRGAVVLLRDVTDEVKRDADRLEFASTVSHELRTPLAAASGYLELLKNSELSPKATEQVAQAYAALRRMSGLLQRFLRTAQIGQDRVKAVVVRPFRIEPEIDAVIAELRPEAEKKGLSLGRLESGEVRRATSAARGDPDRVREVLENLIGNAIKFTEKGGIEVSLDQQAPGRLRVHVRDSGIGMSPEDQGRIFDQYYRVETDFTQAHSGTGLGLYISKGLAASMGGSLTVTSTEGAGSTFTLTLPLASGTA